MKRLITLAVLLLLGFYVAWPGWTGYQVASAIKAKDSATLERKISFPDVRETLKPAAIQKLGEAYDQAAPSIPGAAATLNSIKADVVPKLTDQALNTLVTAPNLIRVVSEAGPLKESAERILREQIAKLGGLPGLGGLGGLGGGGGGGTAGGGVQIPGGLGQLAGKMGIDPGKLAGIPGLGGGAPKADPTPAPAAPAAGAAPPPSYGIANIKRFSFLGPLAFEIGVAKDPNATLPDVVVEMRFVGGDWRVVGVKPRV